MHTDTLKLVGQIYDAVSEPDRWDLFLNSLASSLNAHATRLRIVNKKNNHYGLIAGTGHNSDFDKDYQSYYAKLDPWNPALTHSEPGVIFSSHLCTPDKAFRNSEIYNDFYRHYDFFYAMGGNIFRKENTLARIGVHRERSQGPYAEKEQRLLQQLMPHLIRAYKLGSHLEEITSQRDSMQDALYHSSTPLILIDEFSHIAFTNQQAEICVSSGNGLSIRHNHLFTLRESEQVALQQMIHQAVTTGARKGTGSGGAIGITDKDGEHRFNLMVTPYPSRSASHLGMHRQICAAIFIHDTQAENTLPADLLRTLYGLSPAEIRLAECIVDGLSPAESAAKLGVSVHTTRSQLRSLFAKTGTRRQAELVRHLSGLTTSF